MSRPVTYTSAVTFTPDSFVSGSYQGITGQTTPVGQDSGSNSYATVNLTTGSGAKTYAFWKFDCSTIPSNATINSVTCYAKTYISNTNANRITTRQVNLYTAANTGSTKGTAQTVSNSVSVLTIPGGTWTRSQLDNCYIGLYGVRGTGNTTSTYYFRFYGASLLVNYTISDTEYEVEISNSTTITTDPTTGTTYVLRGESQEIKFNTTDVSNITVTDDGNTINPLPVYQPILSSTTFSPSQYDSTNSSASTSSSNLQNGATSTDSDTYATLYGGRNATYYYYYNFSVTGIPQTAEITKVTLSVKGCKYSTYAWDAILCKNLTEISNVSISTSGSSTGSPTTYGIDTIEDTSFTLADLTNIKLKLKPTAGSSNSRLFFYGANLTINYSLPGTGGTIQYYTYTISNISADHTIVVSDVATYTIAASTTASSLTLQLVDITSGPGTMSNPLTIVAGHNAALVISGTNLNGIILTDNNVDVTSSLVATGGVLSYTITNVQTGHTLVVSQSYSPGVTYVISAITDDFYNFISPYVFYNGTGVYGSQIVNAGDSCEARIMGGPGGTLPQTGFTATDNGVNVTSSLVYHAAQYSWSQDYYSYSLSNVQTDHTVVFGYTGATYIMSASSIESSLGVSLDGLNSAVTLSAKTIAGQGWGVYILGDDYTGLYVTDNGVDVTSSLVYYEEETDGGITYPACYGYGVTNPQENHIIVVSRAQQNTLSIRTNGAWQTVTKAYKKNGNSWGEVSDLTTLFSNGKIYIKKD